MLRTHTLALLSTALFALSPAAHAAVIDPKGDFLTSFTGSQQPALDLLSSEVTFNRATNTFDLRATTAGDIASASNVVYVFGFNTGAATASPFASIGAPGVQFDTVVQLRSNGTGVTAGRSLEVSIEGDTIEATLAADLLPSKGGFSLDRYQWSLWTVDSTVAGLARNADFGPDVNQQVQAVPLPSSLALLGVGLLGMGLNHRHRSRSRA